MPDPVIECRNLTHRYGERLIYENLSFEVPHGRILGLLGKNGTGKTTTINFYAVDDCYFVDLPGYGYAKVSNADRERWDDLINSYFEAPRHHTLLVQLLDCRHAPSADDLQMLRYLHYHRIPYVVALTKADKLKKSQLASTLEQFEDICRPYGCQKVVLTSGENGYGIPELQVVLNAAVAAEDQEAE